MSLNLNDLVAYQRRRIKELEAEVTKMRPVVDAAVEWEDTYTGSKAYDALEAAVQKYKNKKPAPIPESELKPFALWD